MLKFDTPMHLSVAVMDATQLQAIYAVLASTSAAALAIASVSGSGNLAAAPKAEERAKPDTAKPSATEETPAQESPASVGSGETAPTDASPSDVKVDAAGTPFDPDRHTGSIVKSGLWRMKAGLSRGPGEGEDAIPKGDGTGTASDGPEPDVGEAAIVETADEEDEFAAFTKANEEVSGDVEVPARTWADADLSSLCAQAATKLGGNADPIRAVIASYTPEGETPHSRNVPADDREAFAQEIEKLAGITYAG